MKRFILFCLLSIVVMPSVFAACVSDTNTLCLQDNRFKLQVEFRDQAGNPFTVPDLDQSGLGQAHALSVDTGWFSFFTPDNPEMLVKVLNGCSINNRFWVFTAAPSNMEYTLTVTDTAIDTVKSYSNPFGVAAAVITDTTAFATCDATVNSQTLLDTVVETNANAIEGGTCVADDTTLCVQDNRFSIQVNWEDFGAENRLSNTGSVERSKWLFLVF